MSIDLLLDSDILVDIFKQYKPALDWLNAERDKLIGITGFTVFEVLQGSNNKAEMLSLQKKLDKFPIFWASEEDCNRAVETFTSLFLSQNVGFIDALNAQIAIGLNVPIVTRNLKHYVPISELLKIIKPYN